MNFNFMTKEQIKKLYEANEKGYLVANIYDETAVNFEKCQMCERQDAKVVFMVCNQKEYDPLSTDTIFLLGKSCYQKLKKEFHLKVKENK